MKFLSKKVLGPTLMCLGMWFGVSSQAHAVFHVDQLVSNLDGATYMNLNTTPGYLYAGNSMSIPVLNPSQTMRLKILAPPGTGRVMIRGESNDWIGAAGAQPVVGTFDGNIMGDCPVLINGVFMCGGQPLSPPPGGLSAVIYSSGTTPPLSQARYMYFVLHNAAPTTFTFGSLLVTLEITDLNAYKAWLAKRPWNNGGGTLEGLDEFYDTTPLGACSTDTNDLLTRIDAAANINIPNIDLSALGMRHWRVNLIYKGLVDGQHQWVLGPMQALNCHF